MMQQQTESEQPGEAAPCGAGALTTRRKVVRDWWSRRDELAQGAAPPVGLALSGGGIRSATFALGLLQGLAKAPGAPLDRIDILSTVSGGGYIGCFLRSLFVPTVARGIDKQVAPLDPAIVADQYRFARAALASPPNERELLHDGHTYRNPLWWLREHGRYLAPNGPSDYGFAIAYLARNWVAMVYLFMLGCAAIGVVVIGLEAAFVTTLPLRWAARLRISPAIVLLPIPLFAIGAISIAYWATQGMSPNERLPAKQAGQLGRDVVAVLAGAIVAAVAAWTATGWLPAPTGNGVGEALGGLFGRTLGWIFVGAIAWSATGALLALILGGVFWKKGTGLTAQLRLSLTRSLAAANRIVMLVLAVVVIDSLAAWLSELSLGDRTIKTAILLPALAVLIKKLPDWLGGKGKGGAVSSLLRRFATTIALVLGALLYGLLAVLAVSILHHVAWRDAPWLSPPNWPAFLAWSAMLLVMTLLTGAANGFINLSSLHTLYASRLTRAYLGASNRERLLIAQPRAAAGDATGRRSGHPRPVTENHRCDYIQPQVYGQTDLPAPIHIINTTLNETIDANSQIVLRDRKGDILSLEPDGIRIGRDDLYDWDRLTATTAKQSGRAEIVSLGQWCAISGAAASSGMGRMSSLGFALAFTFANIRLGYWWSAPDLCPDWPAQGRLSKAFSSFFYLWSEMTCRYSRGFDRKYLTDGGHYENSGAFVLVQRGVPLILVSDNGADPDYRFEDMQILIRQVRIDLGAEMTLLADKALDRFLGSIGGGDRSIFVDPFGDPKWQLSMRKQNAKAFVLVLHAEVEGRDVHLVWIKPRLLPDVPIDLAGYAALTKSFPQQPTGEQFFDEAQWESYRRLGEESMTRLLAACPSLLAWRPAPTKVDPTAPVAT